eukprot:m.55024 g.55024  ORF g.55024 m.55024 type:complete len:122 (-) comp9233_c0_seq1:147-512(-)
MPGGEMISKVVTGLGAFQLLICAVIIGLNFGENIPQLNVYILCNFAAAVAAAAIPTKTEKLHGIMLVLGNIMLVGLSAKALDVAQDGDPTTRHEAAYGVQMAWAIVMIPACAASVMFADSD